MGNFPRDVDALAVQTPCTSAPASQSPSPARFRSRQLFPISFRVSTSSPYLFVIHHLQSSSVSEWLCTKLIMPPLSPQIREIAAAPNSPHNPKPATRNEISASVFPAMVSRLQHKRRRRRTHIFHSRMHTHPSKQSPRRYLRT